MQVRALHFPILIYLHAMIDLEIKWQELARSFPPPWGGVGPWCPGEGLPVESQLLESEAVGLLEQALERGLDIGEQDRLGELLGELEAWRTQESLDASRSIYLDALLSLAQAIRTRALKGNRRA